MCIIAILYLQILRLGLLTTHFQCVSDHMGRGGVAYIALCYANVLYNKNRQSTLFQLTFAVDTSLLF